MNKIREFIDKYFSLYLSECRTQNPFIEGLLGERRLFFPPQAEEMEKLLLYLKEKGVNALIVGSIAVIKYAEITSDDIKANKYRLTDKLELFVSDSLPTPPPDWKVKVNSTGHTFWISSTNSAVKFFNEREIPEKPFAVGVDRESLRYQCPVADPATIFAIRLKHLNPSDLGDLLLLGLLAGVPKDLDKYLVDSKQKAHLKFVSKWVRMRGKRELP